MSDAKKKTLVQKLAEVMGEVERVPKSGRNEFHRYDYATEADIVASVRKGMAERGVMLIPSIEKIEWSERTTKNGVAKLATITVRFTFLDGDSEAKIEFVGMGQGEDASDKAIYKAMTGAEKYALLKTFLIPTGDDPEADAPRPTNGRPAPAQPTKQQAAAPNGHAKAVSSQLKRPMVVDVKPGETEEAATDRAGREQQTRVTIATAVSGSPPPWEQLEIYCAEHGMTSSAGWGVVRALQERGVISGKFAKKADLDAPALAMVLGELGKSLEARDAVEAKLNGHAEPPPPSDADAPH